MKAEAQTTMAIIMGRGGLPLEGFIVAAKLMGRSKRMNLWPAQQNDEDLLQRFIFKGFLSKSKAKAMYVWDIYLMESIMEVSG